MGLVMYTNPSLILLLHPGLAGTCTGTSTPVLVTPCAAQRPVARGRGVQADTSYHGPWFDEGTRIILEVATAAGLRYSILVQSS